MAPWASRPWKPPSLNLDEWGLSAAVEGLQSIGVAALFGLCSSMQPREPVAVLGLGSDSRSLSKVLVPVAKPNLRQEDDGLDLQGEAPSLLAENLSTNHYVLVENQS